MYIYMRNSCKKIPFKINVERFWHEFHTCRFCLCSRLNSIHATFECTFISLLQEDENVCRTTMKRRRGKSCFIHFPFFSRTNMYVVGDENHTGHNKFLGDYIVSTSVMCIISILLTLFYRSDSGRRRSSASHDIIKRKGSLASISQSTDEDRVRTPTESRRGSDIRTKFIAVREQYHPAKAKLKTFTHFIENNRQHIFFLVIFFGVTFALFAERFYRKSNDHGLKKNDPTYTH